MPGLKTMRIEKFEVGGGPYRWRTIVQRLVPWKFSIDRVFSFEVTVLISGYSRINGLLVGIPIKISDYELIWDICLFWNGFQTREN